MTPFTIKLIVCFIGVAILALPLTVTQDTSEQIHEIDLYLSGERSRGLMFNNVNLTTRVPNSIIGGSQLIDVQLHPGSDPYRWESYPLRMNITLTGDVHITIWATCNQSREIAFRLGFGMHERQGTGSHGHGVSNITDAKLVYNEPIEFNGIITEDKIEKYELKKFHTGSVIYLGVTPFYQSAQPAANVTILYNSTSHPSHMSINTTSVSIEVSNSEVKYGKAFVGVNITNAFSVYDITDYDIKITDPLGRDFDNYNMTEVIYQEEGQFVLNITWDIVGNESSNYIINVIVTDNNNNKWTRVFNPFGGDNGLGDGKEDWIVQLFFPVIVIVILFIISLFTYLVIKMRKKPQSPK
jgi:hypothetical protein